MSLLFLIFFGFVSLGAVYPEIDPIKYPQITKFIEKYRCTPEVEQLIAENSDAVEQLGNGVLKYKNIPYFNKGAAFDRIKNAKRLEKVIQEHGLDAIRVAQKWLCQVDQKWVVIAEKITVSSQPVYPLTQQELEQLTKLTELTGYWDYLKDPRYENIVRDEQGYLVIIDTEDRGFCFSCREAAVRVMENMLNERYAHHKIGLQLNLQTRQWVAKQREQVIFPSTQQFTPTLPDNTSYDDPEINFELLEAEYLCLQKEIEVEKMKQEADKLKVEYAVLLAKIAMGN